MAEIKPKKISVFFAKNDQSEKEPVREWLKNLPQNEKKMIGEDIMAVQYGWPIGMPLVRNLGNGLWEVRTNLENRIARVIFFIHNHKIVLLHGFIKKTQQTPKEDIELALTRKSHFLTK
ncbi:MAG: type II toxin-antitoxin system RelE/ParE family toxin [Candidatus Parabeggiatoa sp.]|nr:type II toxin-antitoxin system RelE/ParE family toxin [Candidatus Parabeggiatoa sp.]